MIRASGRRRIDKLVGRDYGGGGAGRLCEDVNRGTDVTKSAASSPSRTVLDMRPLSATVPISVVNGFLSGADRAAVVRLAEHSGIPHELLGMPAARVTQEQFSTLYRLLAMEL